MNKILNVKKIVIFLLLVIFITTLSACGHKHTFSEEWQSDDNYHWHVATCKHTNEKGSYEEHDFDAGFITLFPTHTSKGVKTFTCNSCGKIKEVEVAMLTDHTFDQEVVDSKYLKTPANCDSKAIYYKSCICGEVGTLTFEAGDKLGHNYGSVSYQWSIDNLSCTATATCANDNTHKISETVNSVKKVTQEQTCDKQEISTFTVTFTNSLFGTEKKENVVTKDARGHAYDVKNTSEEYLKEHATCTTSAIYYYSCTCGLKGNETFTHGDPLGHNYGEPSYVWNEDFTTCTATRVCLNDPNHKEVEVATNDSITSHVSQVRSCLQDEITTYEASFVNSAFSKQTTTSKTADKLSHNYEGASYIKLDDTHHYRECINEGCNEKEISECDLTTNLKHNESGHFYECSLCGNKTNVTAHNYDEETHMCICGVIDPEWCDHLYNLEGYDATHHYLTCEHCGKIDETTKEEHIYNQKVIDSKYLVSNANCEHGSVYYYTCKCGAIGALTFEDDDLLGHDFTSENAKLTWQWSVDYSSAKLVFTCGRNSEHKKEVNAIVTSDITLATCVATGVAKYEATVTIDDVVYKDTVTVTLEIDPNAHNLVIDPKVYPTCTEKGKDEGCHCSLCDYVNEGNDIAPLGHNFSGAFTSYDEDHHYRVCTREGCNEKEIVECNFGETYYHDEHNHWHKCDDCTNKSDVESHSYDEDDLCVCGLIDPLACEHVYSVVDYDDDYHFNRCIICNKIDPNSYVEHSHNQEVVDNKYLKDEATCVSKAIYYRSCTCGHHLEDDDNTFESGSLAEHIYEFDSFVWSGEVGNLTAKAKFICETDHDHVKYLDAEVESYVDTAATCLNKGVRIYTATYLTYVDSTEEDIPLDSNNHESDSYYYIDNCDGTHSAYYYCCDALYQKTSHVNDDNHDCTNDTLCIYCDAIVIHHKEEHNFNSYSYFDKDTHKHSCTNPGCSEVEYESHYGGEATCTVDAICSGCGYHYEEAIGHDFEEASEIDAFYHYCNNGCGHREVHSFGDDNICDICSYEATYTVGLEYTLLGNGTYSVSKGEATDLEVVIPENYLGKAVTAIAIYGFKDYELTSIFIPSSVTSIGDNAFSGCSNLVEVIISSNIESVGEYAFSNCSKLVSITLPSSLTTISSGMFKGCSKLTDVNIEEVVIIEESAFENCTALTRVLLNSSIEVIGANSFKSVSPLFKAYYLGSKADFEEVSNDDSTISSKVYYYSEEKPVEYDRYWHYDSENIIVWTKCEIIGHVPYVVVGYFDITEDEHSFECANCGETITESHRFEEKVATSSYYYGPASCTEGTKYYYSCECGSHGEDLFEQGLPLGHDYEGAVWQTVQEGTCTDDKILHLYCQRPGCDHYEENIIEATGHNFDTENWVCDETNHYHVCSVCGEIDEKSVEEHDLDIENGEVTRDPTCTDEGILDCECKICGEHVEVSIDVVEHTYDAYDHDDDCHWLCCSVCGHAKADTEASHIFNQEIVDEKYLASEANCTEVNKYYRSCICGYHIENNSNTFTSGSPLGHDYDYESPDWVWTKTASGYSALARFTCNNDSNHKDSIDAVVTVKTETLATCSNAGERVYKATITIGANTLTDEYTVELPIDPNNHTPDLTVWHSDDWVEAYRRCVDCLDVVDSTIVTCDWQIKTKTTEPTCVLKGLYRYRCSITGLERDVVISALNHDYTDVDWTVSTPATCEAAGSKYKDCTRCGESGRIVETIAQLPHTPGSEWHSNNDFNHWHICTVCGAPVYESSVAHSYNAVVTPPDCGARDGKGEYGYTTYTCTVCGRTKVADYVAPEHSYVLEVVTAPHLCTPATCQNVATYYYSCSCGRNGEETFEYGDLADHDWSNWNILVDATCTTNGSKERYCNTSGCTEVETADILATGHSFEEEWHQTAYEHWHVSTCEHNLESDRAIHSYVNGVCSVCGYEVEPSDGLIYTNHGSYYSVKNDENNPASGIVVIKDSIGGIPVTTIEENGFEYAEDIEGLILPNSITTIEDSAFHYCENLTTVIIGSGLDYIGNNAFKDCTCLEEVLFTAESISYLGDNAFFLCSLVSIELPSISNIGNGVFESCYYLERIVMPGTYTKITENTFYQCSSLCDVTISNTVTIIEDYAFYYCEALETIDLPNSLTTIGEEAFFGCSALTEITIPNSVNTIGEKVFSETGLEVLTIPSGLVSVPSNFVNGCENLKKVIIQNGTTTISEKAFKDCESLTDLVLSSTLTSIHEDAFYNCDIKNITMAINTFNTNYLNNYSETLDKLTLTGTSVPINAFKDSTILRRVELASGMTSIGNYAFSGCTNLESVTLPDGLTTIGEYAFSNTALTSITIPRNVDVKTNAFGNCLNLKTLVASDDVTISTQAFYGTELEYVTGPTSMITGLSSVKNSLIKVTITSGTSIMANAFKDASSLESLTITGGVVTIGLFAFRGCTKLNSVTLSDSVTTISREAFAGCTNLENITLGNGITSIDYQAFNEVKLKNAIVPMIALSEIDQSNIETLIITNGETLKGNAIKNASKLKTVVLPETLTTIESNAIYNCFNLMKITLPSSLTSISNNAFYSCVKLFEVYNKSSLPIEAGSSNYGGVAKYAFCVNTEEVESVIQKDGDYLYIIDGSDTILVSYLGDDESLELPNYITKIYDNAFYNNATLREITLHDAITSIGERAFYGCTSLTSITIPSSITSIGEQAFYGCTSLTSITIPSSITEISDSLFYGCTELTSVTLHNGITSIGKQAFSNCNKLNGITLPSSLTNLGTEAFRNCTSLTSITIPSTVTVISEGLFRSCRNLSSITLHDAITSIGNYAFYECNSLESITIPSSVTSIGENAFNYCIRLTSIVIPNDITTISESAFKNCKELTDVTLSSNVNSFNRTSFMGCSKLETITFLGTKQQYRNIFKVYNWDNDTAEYIVICTDGKLNKHGSEIA